MKPGVGRVGGQITSWILAFEQGREGGGFYSELGEGNVVAVTNGFTPGWEPRVMIGDSNSTGSKPSQVHPVEKSSSSNCTERVTRSCTFFHNDVQETI